METLDRKAARRPLPFPLALLLCLCMAACADGSGDDREAPDEITGSDWRVTGIVRDSGAVTRNGEDTFVLVCVNAADAAFYYDTEDQTFFDAVEYPITLAGDAWEMFQDIDFADRNGDGNSDVTMTFDDGGSTILMVWFWDTESDSFVFQPDESRSARTRLHRKTNKMTK